MIETPIATLDSMLIAFNSLSPTAGTVRLALAMSGAARSLTLMLLTGESEQAARETVASLQSLLTRSADQHPTVRIVRLALGEDPAESIVTTAHDLHANMIVLALEEDGQELTGHLASEAKTAGEEVTLNARIPVMVLRPGMVGQADVPIRTRRMLVPLDGSAVSRESLPVATMLARQFGVPVHLVTMVDPVSALPPAYAYLSSNDPDRQDAVAGLQREANEALNRKEAILRHAGSEVTSDLIYGPTGDCLISAIQHGDVLVMTTHGKGNASRSRFGSMALRTVRESPAPVVIVHPPVTSVTSEHFQGLWESGVTSIHSPG